MKSCVMPCPVSGHFNHGLTACPRQPQPDPTGRVGGIERVLNHMWPMMRSSAFLVTARH